VTKAIRPQQEGKEHVINRVLPAFSQMPALRITVT